ncbi:hypothetical protein O6P43_004203 [Quillaja saponaria]|uniref:Uncharacterized protein n=1 Tax=Quillaja saponaria TaxID=32244 RepID=A0AAD7Q3A2_QUISA|nr:hypothetical protein O6P43_004203 [Quillaja saponaria]
MVCRSRAKRKVEQKNESFDNGRTKGHIRNVSHTEFLGMPRLFEHQELKVTKGNVSTVPQSEFPKNSPSRGANLEEGDEGTLSKFAKMEAAWLGPNKNKIPLLE